MDGMRLSWVRGEPSAARSYWWHTADSILLGGYTGGAAAMAEEIAADAVAERLGSICVAQFNHDSDKGSKVKEMKDKDTWDKARYIEKAELGDHAG